MRVQLPSFFSSTAKFCTGNIPPRLPVKISRAFPVSFAGSVRNPPPDFSSANQHAIAITVKPVLLFHGVPVSCQHRLAPGKCRNQRQQRGLRQVKIRQQHIRYPKRKSWRDENLRLRFSRQKNCSEPDSSARCAAPSRARTTVVPTASTGRFFSLAAIIFSAASFGIS
jgi:hypothetical protein